MRTVATEVIVFATVVAPIIGALLCRVRAVAPCVACVSNRRCEFVCVRVVVGGAGVLPKYLAFVRIEKDRCLFPIDRRRILRLPTRLQY
jgi:TRAP-type C4-dicarboxylate transport system permease large subunit